ncbi:hypothetical protein Hanom_Chr05g00448241 [Helianthus anomalus]
MKAIIQKVNNEEREISFILLLITCSTTPPTDPELVNISPLIYTFNPPKYLAQETAITNLNNHSNISYNKAHKSGKSGPTGVNKLSWND